MKRTQNGRIERFSLQSFLQNCVQMIQEASMQRWVHRKTEESEKQLSIAYQYYCSQDDARVRQPRSTGKRQIIKRKLTSCHSDLRLQINQEERSLSLRICHQYHPLCRDVHLSDDIRNFIDARISSHTPSEIFRELIVSDLSERQRVTMSQVYYRWGQGNSKNWRHDRDPFQSMMQLLEKESPSISNAALATGGVSGIAFFAEDIIALRSVKHARELAIDASHGTNSAGMELYAILAEVDGTGVPVAYCFVEKKKETDSQVVRGGDMGNLLAQFLGELKNRGFTPQFFGTDKDFAEINAIQSVWPEVNIQLCFWHVKRAVRAKLKDHKKVATQAHYHPAEALSLIPNLEICWGSDPCRRPQGPHRDGSCKCISHPQIFSTKGSIETVAQADRDTVLNIFSQHFNAHSAIPDRHGTLRNPDAIHQQCASEMYQWCRARGFFRLWAYLFVNWYKTSQWLLWARSAHPQSIPVLKTTMIVESHWRRIKHDFLHRFNRPRVDLVTWVLISKVLPTALLRVNAILNADFRLGKCSWRKEFGKVWKKLFMSEVTPQSLISYHTNPMTWTCGCEAFLLSRFLICKHIVYCYEPIEDPAEFFHTVKRWRESPFWRDKQLNPKSEFLSFWSSEPSRSLESMEDSSTNDHLSTASEVTSDEDSITSNRECLDIDGVEDQEDHQRRDCEQGLIELEAITKLYREQLLLCNLKFCLGLRDNNHRNRNVLDDVAKRHRSQSLPRTWGKHKNPVSFYYIDNY